jgi:hypothetical protein
MHGHFAGGGWLELRYLTSVPSKFCLSRKIVPQLSNSVASVVSVIWCYHGTITILQVDEAGVVVLADPNVQSGSKHFLHESSQFMMGL